MNNPSEKKPETAPLGNQNTVADAGALLFTREEAPKTFGRYERLERLGQGGMGIVFKADDPALSRPVALKFIRREDPLLVERLQMEARAQARIEHEHVCKVYEVGVIDGVHYIAMQYIDGKSLKDLIPQLPLERKVKLMKQVAEAVHAAHRAGLIHRDLKPANVLVECKQVRAR